MADIQTLLKALDILKLLGEKEGNLSVESISMELEIPESTTYRLLQTLEKRGFVERASRGSIALGSAVLSLARDTYEKMDRQLGLVADTYMESITEKVGETSILSVRSGLYSTCIKSVPCNQRIRFVADEKRLIPVFQGAAGRAILSFESEKTQEMAIQKLDSTEKREFLRKQLKETQKNGYTISYGEYDAGTMGIAVPIYDRQKRVYASVCVVGPAYRMDEETAINEIVPVLFDASKSITEELFII